MARRRHIPPEESKKFSPVLTEGDRLGTLPRYAKFRGRRVRIIDYIPKVDGEQPDRPILILDADDSKRWVGRHALTFLR